MTPTQTMHYYKENPSKITAVCCLKLLVTLPETNSSHLKHWGWKVSFPLGPGLLTGTSLMSSQQ